MNEDSNTSPETALREMVQDRFPEGLIRVLEGRYPRATHADYEDAVSTGFEKLVRSDRQMESPRGYVTTVADNAMKKILKRSALEQLAEASDDEDELVDRPASEWADEPLDEVVANDAYAFMHAEVERWESRNVKTTMLLVLAAAKVGEPLSSAELAERLEQLLDQDVTPENARQLRKRGLDRLRRELVAADLLEDTETS